jgi:hypothetical protein
MTQKNTRPLRQTGGGLRRKHQKIEFLPYPNCMIAVNTGASRAFEAPLKRDCEDFRSNPIEMGVAHTRTQTAAANPTCPGPWFRNRLPYGSN